jgi:branched-chain amino acid transport system permease protein
MDEVVAVLLTGVSNGAVYGLMGLGLVIIFQSTDVVNFAMVSLATIAIYVGLTFIDSGVPVVLGLFLALAAAAAIALSVREVAIRPLGDGRLFAALVVTMGISLIAEHLVSVVWGESPRAFPRIVGGAITVGSTRMYTQDLLTIVIAAVAMLAVAALFTRTPMGTTMRAVAESSEVAAILGVKAQRVARLAWVLGLVLATLAAFLYAPKTGVAPTALAAVLFRAFAGIFLGGLNSMYGAVVGGLVIGVMESVAATYISASFRDTFVFSVAILILLVRPQGLFGRVAFQRV